MSGAKTLDNGLRVLKTIASTGGGITLSEIAERTSLHPTVVFRLLHTLEDNQLIRRDLQKRYTPASGLIPLAAAVDSDLRTTAEPILRSLSEDIRAASYLMVPISHNQVIAELVVQPSSSSGYITFSVGSVHDINRGSGGIAILAGRPPSADDSEAVIEARREGVAVSDGQVLPNVIGVAAALTLPAHLTEASIGVSVLLRDGLPEVKKAVKSAAAAISGRI